VSVDQCGDRGSVAAPDDQWRSLTWVTHLGVRSCRQKVRLHTLRAGNEVSSGLRIPRGHGCPLEGDQCIHSRRSAAA
jgi:hypothetical protein